MTDRRIGAQAFLEQLMACGVEWVFGNPGTTEQTVIDYIQDYPQLGLILALHEGVAVGAADGYARASGRLGVVLLAGRLPASPAAVARLAAGHDVVVAIGTRVLAQVFPGDGAPLGDRVVIHIGADDWELAKNQPSLVVRGDERACTEELLAALDEGAPDRWRVRGAATAARIEQDKAAALAADRKAWDAIPMSPQRALAELGVSLPDGTCVIDEAMSSYEAAARYLPKRRGAWFRGAGGIGMGLPRAIGAQLADPGRPVVAVVGDGASMYSLTALWTAAHHRLPVTWVILANRSYRTLKQNVLMSRQPGAASHEFIGADLTDPVVDFTSLAAGFGVPAWRVERPDQLGAAVGAAIESGGPALIELIVSGEL